MTSNLKLQADFMTIEKAAVDFMVAECADVRFCSGSGEWELYDTAGADGALFSISALALAIAEALRRG